MDAYEEMLDLARRTVGTLNEKGVRPRPFTADDGTTVKGWCVKQLADHAKDEYRGLDNWEEFRCTIDLVLGDDGRFFSYTETWNNHSGTGGKPVHEHSRVLRHESAAYLIAVGPGKPFAAVSTLLERLPWTASSYSPPRARPAPVTPAPSVPSVPSTSGRRAARSATAPPARPRSAVGAVLGFGGGLLFGCAAGGAVAIVLGIALSIGGMDGDRVGVTTFVTAMFCVAAGAVIGAVNGWRTPAKSSR
ncbi:hypothetical protein ABZ434_04120 [Streptomyces sp. NPDC005761]|uniref:hypothetical protein n=1 Tax=Streptomyces sp. NPDC005761 TaxID=3157066 RepID=UPI0033EEC1D4